MENEIPGCEEEELNLPDGYDPVNLAPVIQRKFAWDITSHADIEEFMTRIGLVPGHEDVLEMEHKESHLRQLRMAYLMPIVSALFSVGVDVYTEACLNVAEDSSKITEEYMEQFKGTAYVLSRSLFFAVLGQLLDLEVLSTTDPRTLSAKDFMGGDKELRDLLGKIGFEGDGQ